LRRARSIAPLRVPRMDHGRQARGDAREADRAGARMARRGQAAQLEVRTLADHRAVAEAAFAAANLPAQVRGFARDPARPADPLPRTAAVGRHLETRIAGAFG